MVEKVPSLWDDVDDIKKALRHCSIAPLLCGYFNA
jgi:hypothetical protein